MSDSFDDRLEAAIQRGRRRGKDEQAAARRDAMSDEELKQLHTSYRLSLSDRIESAVRRLCNHFPGFQQETLFGEKGWGAACSRDDLSLDRGRRSTRYSRLEMTIRPLGEYMVLELKGKGTIANKEIYNRSHFVDLVDVDVTEFERLIDAWVVEYAEQFATQA